MAKSKGRLLAELLGSDGKVKDSKSALTISDGKLSINDIPTLPNSKLQNSSISIAGHSTSLGGTVSLNTGDISEHTDYQYFTTAKSRGAISATGSLSYNSTTGVMSFSMPALNTSNVTEGSRLYYTNSRVDARIVAAGSSKWNTAYGWGDHASAGYSTSNTVYSIQDGELSQNNFTDADHTKLNAIAANANNYTHPTAHAISFITGLQTALDGKVDDSQVLTNVPANALFTDTVYTLPAGYATETYVGNQITALVDSSPATMDTLNELAAALGDDPNFATTVSTSIGTKWTQDNTKISQWNTAYGWGNHASAGYLTSYTDTNTHTHLDRTDNRTISPSEYSSGDLNFGFTSWANNNTYPYADFIHMRSYTDSSGGSDNMLMFKKSGIGMRLWQQTYGSSTAYSNYVDVWTSGNDGSGSGLDADLLDGQHGSYYYSAANPPPTYSKYLRSDTSDSVAAGVTYTWAATDTTGIILPRATGGQEAIHLGGWSTDNTTGISRIRTSSNLHIDSPSNGGIYLNNYNPSKSVYMQGGNKAWHAGNDGSGSGLDADLLDGQHGSYYYSAANPPPTYAKYLRSDANDSASGTLSLNGRVNIGHSVARPSSLNSDSVAQARIGGSDVYLYVASLGSGGGYKVAVQAARASDFASFTLNLQSNGGGLQRGGNLVWDSGTDGSGSGLDADLLDGQHGSYYAPASSIPSVGNGTLTVVTAGSASGGGTFTANQSGNTTITVTGATIPTSLPANGGNADTVDNLHAASFLRSDANDTATGTVTFNGHVNLQGNVAFSKPIENFNTFTANKIHSSTETNMLAGKGTKLRVTVDGVVSTSIASALTNLNYEDRAVKGYQNDADKVINIDLVTNGLYGSNGITYAAGFVVLNFYSSPFPSGYSARVKNKDNVWTTMTLSKVGTTLKGTIPISNYITDLEFTLSSGTTGPFVTGTEVWGLSDIAYYGTRMALSQGPLVTSIGGYIDGNLTFGKTSGSPFYVNSSTVVTNLNADKLDGQHASAFLGVSAKAADSNLLDGLDLHTGRNNQANKVVRTDSSGYLNAGWINTTSGARTTQAITRVYASDDDFLRYYTLANFGSQIANHINYNSLQNKPTIPSLSGYATETYVGNQITALVDSSPTTLDTLNELAAALGDDPNFATTITNSIGTKLPISGKAADSNLLDGINSTSFLRSDANDTFTGNITTGANNHITFGPNGTWGSSLRVGGNGRTATGTEMASMVTTDGNLHLDAAASNNGVYLNFYAGTNGTFFGNGAGATTARMQSNGQLYKSSGGTTNPYWNSTNDGSGSGLDADLLDGQHGSYYLAYGNLTGTPTIPTIPSNNVIEGGTSYSGEYPMVARTSANTIYSHNGIKFNGAQDKLTVAGSVVINGSTSWHAGNDGSGSGLDADLLDGQHGSYYYSTANPPPTYTETDTLATVTGRGASTSTDITISAAGRTLYNSNSHAYIQVGPSGGGAAGTFGAHRLTTSGALDYTTYIGYDTFYSDTTQKWHALRSNLGRKWKVNFGGYHQNKFTIGTYDGGGTSGSSIAAGWLEADWTERFTVDASGGNGVKVLGNTVWHAGNDGSGSGLDADLLDGLQASSFMRSDAVDSFTSVPNFASAASGTLASRTGFSDFIGYNSSYGSYIGGGVSNAGGKYLYAGGFMNDGGTVGTLWRSTNDGSGSGLDADLLDGQHGSYYYSSANPPPTYSKYLRSDADDSFTGNNLLFPTLSLNISNSNGAGSGNTYFRGSSTHFVFGLTGGNTLYMNYGNSAGAFRTEGTITHNSALVGTKPWGNSNDGSGSGLDADLLDGLQSDFAPTVSTIPIRNANGDISAREIVLSSGLSAQTPTVLVSMYPTTNQLVRTTPNAVAASMAGSILDQRTYNSANAYLGSHYINGGTGQKPNNSLLGAGKLKLSMQNSGNLGFGGAWNDVLWMSSYNGSDVKRSTAIVSSKYDTTSLFVAKQDFDSGTWGTGYLLWNTGNDGSGSGLDADLLDGQHGSYYYSAGNPPPASGDITSVTAGTGLTGGGTSGAVTLNVIGGSGITANANDIAVDSSVIRTTGNQSMSGTKTFTGQVNVDYGSPKFIVGSTSNLDTTDSNRPNITLNGGMYPHMTIDARVDGSGNASTNTAHGPVFSFVSRLGTSGYRRWAMGTAAYNSGALSWGYADNNANPHYGMGGNTGYISTGSLMWLATTGVLTTKSQGNLWGASNDGSGSGLDADLLDGQHGSYYAPASHNHSGVYLPVSGKAADSELLDGIDSSRFIYGSGNVGKSTSSSSFQAQPSGFFFYSAATGAPTAEWYNWITARGNSWGNGGEYSFQLANSFWNKRLYFQHVQTGGYQGWDEIWTSATDGSGSGLDADLLDGQQGSYYYSSANPPPTYSKYLRSDTADTATGKITFNAGFEGNSIFLNGAQNFDALKTSGFYSLYNATATGHTNAPFQYGAMISANNTAAGGGMGMQLAHERTGAGTFIRGMNDSSDTWYAWQRIFMDNYHPNADKWTTLRTLFLTGDVTGSVNWDGSGNATMTTTVGNDSHSHSNYLPIAGKAADSNLLDGIDSNRVIFGTNTSKVYRWDGDWNTMFTTVNTGFIDNASGTNGNPDGFTHHHGFQVRHDNMGNQWGFQFMGSYHPSYKSLYHRSVNAGTWSSWKEIWDSGNDGSGSGLDADLLDGQHGSYYATNSSLGNYLPLAGGRMTGMFNLDDQKIQFGSGGNSGTTFGANHYSMGVDIANGGWSGTNYSDLIIGYHTGVRIGGGYSGVRFYNNSPTTDTNNTGNGNGGEALLMTIGGGGSSTSGTNVTVNNSLIVGGVIDANGGHGGINITNSSILSSATSTWTGNPGAAGKIQYHSNRWYIVSDSSSNKIVQFRRDGSDKSYIDNNGALIGGGNWYSGNDGSGSGLDADTVDGIQGASFLRSDAVDTIGARLTMGLQHALVPADYGIGVTGLYSSTRYQHVWSMGSAYGTNSSGTSYGNMYGLTYTHTNVGTGTNQAISGLSHQLQHRTNGVLTAAIGSGIWTSGNVTAYSDIAVKTNLVKIPNALEKVCSINGYTYERTDYVKDLEDPEAPDVLRQAGVVAQEVEKILPEVVSGKDGNKAVAYGNMVALMIEAIKELKDEVDELKAQLKNK